MAKKSSSEAKESTPKKAKEIPGNGGEEEMDKKFSPFKK